LLSVCASRRPFVNYPHPTHRPHPPPAQHPARDAHDTFFLTHPATSDTFPEDYLERVKVRALCVHCVCALGVCWGCAVCAGVAMAV